MPFLDHLEELRTRLLRALGALVVCFGVGLWLVEQFQVVALLKRPIEQYLPDGRLVFLNPTAPLLIVFKLGFIVGLLLASPVIIWQIWAFLSPALYERERRVVVPALSVGVVLFLIGAALGYLFVVPQALKVLFGFQSEALSPMITYDGYFDFVLQIVLALGLSFELPLVIVILALLGVATPAGLSRFRRVAVVLSAIAGAVLSPGADVISMVMMTIPLVLLYEIGFAGAVVIHRRRLRKAATAVPLVLLALAAWPRPALAQQDSVAAVKARADSAARADSLRLPGYGIAPGAALDTTQARRLGLPTEPSMQFAPPDSAYSALLQLPGYNVVKFRSDSARVLAEEKELRLSGRAMTERDGSVMEADEIEYADPQCRLDARGDPKLFGQGEVLVGDEIHYDTCRRRGVVRQALTTFEETGTTWFLRGNVAKDSVNTKLFAGHGELTSCDLPVPHYHFAARRLKWVSREMIAARSVVIYVRDVPVFWMPFLWQDMRPGRHSGILTPQVGLNDIVRTNSSYNRQIVNVGYYWVINDYLDATFWMDWYARRYIRYAGRLQYRWLDRFIDGGLQVDRQDELGEVQGNSMTIAWNHSQRFNINSSVNIQLNYSTNTTVRNNNAIDPILNTRQITSAASYRRRFAWGDATLGGSARQSTTDESITLQLPSLSVTPKPIGLSRSVTWSPGLLVTNDLLLNQRRGDLLVTNPSGGLDTLKNEFDQRTTAANLRTPIRFGSFDWQNSVRFLDQSSSGRDSTVARVPDESTPDPTDSITVRTFRDGSFRSEFDWETGVNLPLLFRSTWKLQPTLGVTNRTAGAFAIRNVQSGGDWVTQGKRFQFSLSLTPTFFGFFNLPGLGLSRIRHSINPLLRYAYSPSASIPDDYARAVSIPGQSPLLESPATQTLSLSLQQNFEGKQRPLPGDTLGTSARKLRLLSIQTSAITYDFEQAKLPGRTGWQTNTLTNSLLSDLLPGFSVSLTHDLFDGTAGIEGARLDPFLQSLQANFQVTPATVQALLRVFGLGRRDTTPGAQRPPPGTGGFVPSYPGMPGTTFGRNPMQSARRPFSAQFGLTMSRFRQEQGQTAAPPPSQKNLSYAVAFSPTAFWGLSWNGQYDITTSTFVSQSIALDRDLHEWKARFEFRLNPNGNRAFYFSIFLTDLPDLKWDYNQTTFEE